jgi:hypothetical protein
VDVLVFDAFNYFFSLRSVTILDHSLDDPAAIMFVAELLVLVLYQLDTLIYKLVLFLIVNLLFLHEQSAVIYL